MSGFDLSASNMGRSGFNGRGSGCSGGGFSPLSLPPLLWLKADAGLFQEEARTTPAVADNDPLGGTTDYSGNANHPAQATSSKRGTLKTASVNGRNSILFDAVDDFLQLPTPIVLSGAFTVYAVGTRATGTNFAPLGHATLPGVCEIFSDNMAYIADDASTTRSVAYTGSAGTIITRFRRDAANVVWLAATGMAEVFLSGGSPLAGDITFNTYGARVGSAQFNGGTNKHGELILKAADIVTDNPAQDAQVLAYLQGRWGVSLP